MTPFEYVPDVSDVDTYDVSGDFVVVHTLSSQIRIFNISTGKNEAIIDRVPLVSMTLDSAHGMLYIACSDGVVGYCRDPTTSEWSIVEGEFGPRNLKVILIGADMGSIVMYTSSKRETTLWRCKAAYGKNASPVRVVYSFKGTMENCKLTHSTRVTLAYRNRMGTLKLVECDLDNDPMRGSKAIRDSCSMTLWRLNDFTVLDISGWFIVFRLRHIVKIIDHWELFKGIKGIGHELKHTEMIEEAIILGHSCLLAFSNRSGQLMSKLCQTFADGFDPVINLVRPIAEYSSLKGSCGRLYVIDTSSGQRRLLSKKVSERWTGLCDE